MSDRVSIWFTWPIVESGTNEAILDPRHPYTRLLLSAILDPMQERGRKATNGTSDRKPDAAGHVPVLPDVHRRRALPE